MRPGSHAAGDGSFGRSAGVQVGRATALLVVAVLIGLILLHRSPGGGGLVAAGRTTTTSGTGAGPDTTLRQTSTNSTRPNSSSTSSTQPLRAKADIKVLVANGTTTGGLAGTVSTTLRGKGYNTLASTNTTIKVTSTSVYFQPGYDGDAAALATVLGLPAGAAKPMPAALPVPSVSGVNILVVVGPELAGNGTTATTRSTSGAGHTTTT